MNIFIEASHCKAGGGVQVADSVCRNLNRFPQHHFVITLSDQLKYLETLLTSYTNVTFLHYTSTIRIKSLITGRDKYLDAIVNDYKIDAVMFIFGPSLWIPKVPTVSGFAMPHMIIPESPFWHIISLNQKIYIKIRNYFHKRSFKKLSNCYYTENPEITIRLKRLFPEKRVETITNTFHQVFNSTEDWIKNINLPDFNGYTLLTVCAPYLHKNLDIIPKVLEVLEKDYPDLNIRFVLTCNREDINGLDENNASKIIFLGKVNINQCPWLYRQSDAMFLPTLLECFSANYAEAMKMEVPILTSNLGFATGLCGDAALYFNPISPNDIAEKISLLFSDNSLRTTLIGNGLKKLISFDSSDTRTNKIISLIEEEYEKQSAPSEKILRI